MRVLSFELACRLRNWVAESDDLGMVVDQVMATICDEDAPAASSSKRSKAAKPPSSSRRV